MKLNFITSVTIEITP